VGFVQPGTGQLCFPFIYSKTTLIYTTFGWKIKIPQFHTISNKVGEKPGLDILQVGTMFSPLIFGKGTIDFPKVHFQTQF